MRAARNGVTRARPPAMSEQAARAEASEGYRQQEEDRVRGQDHDTGTPVAMSSTPSTHRRQARVRRAAAAPSTSSRPSTECGRRSRARSTRRRAWRRGSMNVPDDAGPGRRIGPHERVDLRGARRTCRSRRARGRGRRRGCAGGPLRLSQRDAEPLRRAGLRPASLASGCSALNGRAVRQVTARSSQTRSAFCAWSRFSASSQTTLCGPSMTSASTS